MGLFIVGEMPSKTTLGSTFSGPSGQHLTDMLGMPWESVMVGLSIWLKPPGHYHKATWQIKGRALRERLALESPYSHVLLAGRRVAESFGFDQDEPYYQRIVRRHVRYYIVPHPSRKNRLWNDVKEEKRFHTFVFNLIADLDNYPEP